MKLKKRNRNFYLAVSAGMFALALLVCGFLFSFDINLPGELESKLYAAKATWRVQVIDDYRYTVRFGGALMPILGVRVTVVDGQVVQVEEDTNVYGFLSNTPPEFVPTTLMPDWYMNSYSGAFPETLGQYTVERLFTFLEYELGEHPRPIIEMCYSNWHFEAEVNEERGYIENLSYSGCSAEDIGAGFLCAGVADCSMGFHIHDFEALPDN
jgi:hypothetical protein